MANDDTVDDLLDAETIVVVGCSRSPEKDAHRIPKYLNEHGYRIVPINPHAESILGETSYDRLTDVPEEIEIDVVDVFRPSEAVPNIIEDALSRRDEVGDVQGIWLQLGIRNDEAAASAESAGIAVVQDRCMKIEHGRRR
ncbi:CoA-binding protein [Halopenitus sp. H-Gu1]|uniref:CoA-binding protein n=1 Tax=Halopenitus sp. H-Gu1 TaxID=3242697 RepID=UPI00359D0798